MIICGRVALILSATIGLSAASLEGHLFDQVTKVEIPIESGDVVTYRVAPAGPISYFLTPAPDPGYFGAPSVSSNTTYRLDFQLAGYVPDSVTITVSAGVWTENRLLTRSSLLASLSFDRDTFYDDEYLTATVSLDSPFPKAATEIDLGFLDFDSARVELQNSSGQPLGGTTLSIPAGETAVVFRLAGRPSPSDHADQTGRLEASAAAIPSGGNHVTSPDITLKDSRRTVTLDVGSFVGVVQGHDPTDPDPVVSQATAGGEVVFKGLPTSQPTLFTLTPGVAD